MRALASCTVVIVGLLSALVMVVMPIPAEAIGVAELSNQETIQGLKDALAQGSQRAILTLGRQNGFLGNPRVRIPLPESLQRIEGAMRTVGMGKQADELIAAMNRAAEAAVPEAKALMLDAVKRLTVSDAKTILTGGEHAATDYFRATMSPALTERFMPVVSKAMARVKLAETYDTFAGKAAAFGLIDKKDASLESYITQRALDGLFLMMADEERAIRKNPLAAASSIAKKVFEAIGR